MIKYYLTLFFKTFLVLGVFSQTSITTYLSDNGLSPREQFVDFIHLKADLKFDVNQKMVFGMVTHQFVPKRFSIDSLFIDAPSIKIIEVKDDEILKFKTNKNGLWVYFNSSIKESHEISITYEAKPKKGLYFIGWDDKNNLMKKQIWTQGQGIDNRHWLPCFDDQADKITTDISIEFEEGYEVISNGDLITSKSRNGKTNWRYKMNNPHAPYLIMIAVGEYKKLELKSKSGVPLSLYYYADQENRVEQTYRLSAEMMDWMESYLNYPYPWGTYKQVPVADFLYGAMENTSATIFGDFYMVDKRSALDKEYLEVNMHELAHQWFGDLITSRSGAHHWLHESFATFFQMRYAQVAKGGDYYRKWMRENAEAAFGQSLKDEMGIGHSMAGSNRHYLKGAFVVDMLAYVVGEEKFKETLSDILTEFEYKNVETDDFLFAFHETTGQSLSWFFNQWVKKGGEPYYKIQFEIDSDSLGSIADFEIEQIQKQTATVGLFKMPIKLEVHYKDGSKDSTMALIENKTHHVTIKIDENKELDYVLFDPNSRILKKVSFLKSREMLLSQAIKANNMIDRLDAVKAMASWTLDEKLTTFNMLIKTEKFEAVKSEIAIQLNVAPNNLTYNLIKTLLADFDSKVQKAVLTSTQFIPAQLLGSYEALLQAQSYEVVELALRVLYNMAPQKMGEYLKSTNGIIGTKAKNVRITWLELKIATTGDLDYIDELSSYVSSSYDYLTRVKAAQTFKKLDYVNIEIAKNLMSAVTNFNGRLRRPCGKILKEFYQKIPFKPILEQAYFTGDWSEDQKKAIQVYLR